MRLHDIKPRPGAKHRRKRLGSGESSGLGKTCGRGHKGQKSRSGGGVRTSFEGGQMPLYRRLPKRGFNNAQFKTVHAVVNVGMLEERFEAGTEITEELLREARLIKGRYDGLKILGTGDLSKKFSITADNVSASAKEKIEKAGGAVSIIPKVERGPRFDTPDKPKKPAAKKAAAKKPAAKKAAPETTEAAPPAETPEGETSE